MYLLKQAIPTILGDFHIYTCHIPGPIHMVKRLKQFGPQTTMDKNGKVNFFTLLTLLNPK